MKWIKYSLILLILLQVEFSCADPMDYYKKVDRIVWVVEDLREVIREWKMLGLYNIIDHGQVNLSNRSNESVDVYMASANFGGARITWLQPLSGNNIFTEFLSKGGDGAFALMHRVPAVASMEQETTRLNGLGVGILLRGKVETDEEPVHFVFFDTEKEGKYVLGLITGPDDMNGMSGQNQLEMKFAQYAFAIRDPDPVSGFWVRLGFPPLEITHGENWEKEYYGEAADFDMKLGWQRHGTIVYEWCIPLKGPTVYSDHIKKHGEGFQHLGFNVQDMDKAIEFFRERGYEISMSGGWGEKGKPGSGRFAYVDIERIGGETIELLWSYQ